MEVELVPLLGLSSSNIENTLLLPKTLTIENTQMEKTLDNSSLSEIIDTQMVKLPETSSLSEITDTQMVKSLEIVPSCEIFDTQMEKLPESSLLSHIVDTQMGKVLEGSCLSDIEDTQMGKVLESSCLGEIKDTQMGKSEINDTQMEKVLEGSSLCEINDTQIGKVVESSGLSEIKDTQMEKVVESTDPSEIIDTQVGKVLESSFLREMMDTQLEESEEKDTKMENVVERCEKGVIGGVKVENVLEGCGPSEKGKTKESEDNWIDEWWEVEKESRNDGDEEKAKVLDMFANEGDKVESEEKEKESGGGQGRVCGREASSTGSGGHDGLTVTDLEGGGEYDMDCICKYPQRNRYRNGYPGLFEERGYRYGPMCDYDDDVDQSMICHKTGRPFDHCPCRMCFRNKRMMMRGEEGFHGFGGNPFMQRINHDELWDLWDACCGCPMNMPQFLLRGNCHCGNLHPGLYKQRQAMLMMRGRRHNHEMRHMDPHERRRRHYDEMEENSTLSTWLKEPEPEPEPCPVGAGLVNMGYTCFLNAIMQCFTHTVPLVQGLQASKHEKSSHGDNEFCVLCAVREQMESSIASSGRIISPTYLVENLNKINSDFRRYQQEDAHEFLMCLLDKLDSDWSKYENVALESSSDDNLVKQLFGGRLMSQLHCSNCDHNSDTYDPLIDLSLEIEDVDSLEKALKSFTKVENIEEAEKFKCENCKEQVTGEKQLMLDQVPPVAALHLKRFKNDGIHVEKIDKRVDYPLSLDFKPYTKGSEDEEEKLKYELFAFVVHVGLSATSGHYFSYIRSGPEEWYRFDDSKVTRVSEETALRQDAYILFYARKGTTWFNSLIEEWKASAEKKNSSSSPKSVLDKKDIPSTSGDLVVEEKPVAAEGTSAAPLGVLKEPNEVETKATDPQDTVAESRAAVPASVWQCHEEANGNGPKSDTFPIGADNNCIQSSSKDESASGRIATDSCHTQFMVDNEVKHADDIFAKPSPPSSHSPDIYSNEECAEEQPYQIPFDHLKIEDKKSSAKRSAEKVKNDLKKREAIKCLKSWPSARRSMYMAALNASHASKKRRQQTAFLQRQSPKKKVKISPKRPLRTAVA